MTNLANLVTFVFGKGVSVSLFVVCSDPTSLSDPSPQVNQSALGALASAMTATLHEEEESLGKVSCGGSMPCLCVRGVWLDARVFVRVNELGAHQVVGLGFAVIDQAAVLVSKGLGHNDWIVLQ